MIKVESLQFGYKKNFLFIKDMNFSVKEGEIFGFLGPSGAGKSTLQKILTGQLKNYGGYVNINGVEVRESTQNFYEEIGIDFEFPSLYEKMSAKENLQFFASLYKKKGKSIEELLEKVGLERDADKKVGIYSKGMKSRLNFIKALLHEPKLLFLDEPTSGLDPTNARIMKDIIFEEKAKGKTIILTTHNMYDAQELCDRVAFIVDGEIKAMDTPHNLIMKKGAAQVRYSWLEENIEKEASCRIDETGTETALLELLAAGRIKTIHSGEPSLNDIFMEVTGRTLV